MTLTALEVEQGRAYLEQSLTELVGATQGLSPDQWTFQAAPDRWSILGIVEHIAVTNEVVVARLETQLLHTPPVAERDPRAVDEIILTRFQGRQVRFPSPELLHPTGRYQPAETLERVRQSYRRLAATLEQMPALREHVLESAPLKAISGGAYAEMDGYQWLLAAGAHAERHTKQILEVRGDPNFPSH